MRVCSDSHSLMAANICGCCQQCASSELLPASSVVCVTKLWLENLEAVVYLTNLLLVCCLVCRCPALTGQMNDTSRGTMHVQHSASLQKCCKVDICLWAARLAC